jgi:hypothetical protein
MPGRAPLILLVLVALPAVARADNVLRPAGVELYPTHAAVGIEVSYTDDDNGNAQASFVWRPAGSATWRNGVDMTFERSRRKIWASIWPLQQGETIEVAITFDDPDGKPSKWEGKTTIRSFNFAPAGRTFYVAPTGDDSAPGSKDRPFRTLAHAGKQLQPGDTLLALSGVYAEGNLFSGLKGTAEKSIVVAAAPGHKPILDSSVAIAAKSGVWKAVGDGVFVTPSERSAGAGYLAQDGRRMFPYPSLAELRLDKLQVKRAWFYDAKAKLLYVRTGTGAEPDAHSYHLARHEYGFHLSGAHNVVIRGFTMRHYGSVAVRLSEGAANCVLYENTIHNSTGGIFIKSETTRDNAIWKNEIYEVGATDFSWNAHYAIEYPNQAIYCDRAGRGNSFCHNVIHGYFDLISVESWKNPDKLQFNRDCDILFNVLYNASDDAIEVDGGGVNLRIHGNRIRNCRTAISLAPVERGPVYVTRNDVTFLGLFIKFNVGGAVSHGWTYIYHNSAYCLVRGEDGGTAVSFSPTLPCTNKVFKNNVVMVNEWCVRAWRPGNAFDYNCYYHIPNRAPRRFQTEKKTLSTIADFAKATGQEGHGLYADPLFAVSEDAGKYASPGLGTTLSDIVVLRDAKSGELRLRAGSPCIDRGVVIRGINEDFRGKAPDIGAFENE